MRKISSLIRGEKAEGKKSVAESNTLAPIVTLDGRSSPSLSSKLETLETTAKTVLRTHSNDSFNLSQDVSKPKKSKIFSTKSLEPQNIVVISPLDNKLSVSSLPSEIPQCQKQLFPAAVSIAEELEKVKEMVRDTERTKELITKMLPSDVARQLKSGTYVAPKEYENVTIYFSDIIGFTTLAAELKPKQVLLYIEN